MVTIFLHYVTIVTPHFFVTPRKAMLLTFVHFYILDRSLKFIGNLIDQFYRLFMRSSTHDKNVLQYGTFPIWKPPNLKGFFMDVW